MQRFNVSRDESSILPGNTSFHLVPLEIRVAQA